MINKNTKIIHICLILLFYAGIIKAQDNSKISIDEYIEIYKEIAQSHMKTFKIPASIKLAQGILESASGNSELARKANNHFGVKCHNDWTGETYHKDDDAKDECFRKYKKAEDSFNDHSVFLTTRKRYAFLFDIEITDYKSWANGLKQAGYATNPKYPELLINLIEKYKLHQYDTVKPDVSDDKPKSGKDKEIAKPVNAVEKRQVFYNNRVKYIIARENDSFLSLAAELNMGTWQFYRYNDLSKDSLLKGGQTIYIQPKRRRSYEHRSHIVAQGETLYSISQQYAVKMRHLHRLNPELHPDGELTLNQIIYLQKQKRIFNK